MNINSTGIESNTPSSLIDGSIPPQRKLFEFVILIMMAIMIISYKGYVLFYVCVSRLLKNAFREWNKWAMEVLNRNVGKFNVFAMETTN